MLTVVAFIFALGILIAIHEWGHYRVALACGIKVLRFSIGFGKPLLRWTSKKTGVEFVLCALPLGGYVRMLGQGEAVPQEQRHLEGMAFDRQSLPKRFAVVAAGPLANLLLAVLLLTAVNWVGQREVSPRLATPPAGSLLDSVGVRGGYRVLGASIGTQATFLDTPAWQEVRSMADLRWVLTSAAIDRQDVWLTVEDSEEPGPHTVHLAIGGVFDEEPDAAFFERVGVLGPWLEPVISEVLPDGAAARAGLQAGDVVLRVADAPVADGLQLRRMIRALGESGAARAQPWRVLRNGAEMDIVVQPDVRTEGEGSVGVIRAGIGRPPELVLVRHGLWDGLVRGSVRCWDLSLLTLRVLGRMVTGQASLKNISGPLTIADFAGKSASMGLVHYLSFLALISLSLGVLNLLPLPVLDGGHLVYYLWEGATGRSVSGAWAAWLQRAGVAVLGLMMCVALYNDVMRLLG